MGDRDPGWGRAPSVESRDDDDSPFRKNGDTFCAWFWRHNRQNYVLRSLLLLNLIAELVLRSVKEEIGFTKILPGLHWDVLRPVSPVRSKPRFCCWWGSFLLTLHDWLILADLICGWLFTFAQEMGACLSLTEPWVNEYVQVLLHSGIPTFS